MSKSTTIIYSSGDVEVIVEKRTDELSAQEFMQLVGILFQNIYKYSEHELQEYILDWADEIIMMREN